MRVEAGQVLMYRFTTTEALILVLGELEEIHARSYKTYRMLVLDSNEPAMWRSNPFTATEFWVGLHMRPFP